MLLDPAGHERLTAAPWDPQLVRAAIRAIAADAEGAFDDARLWPPHPRDLREGPLEAVASLYLGASGVIWALDDLRRRGAAELTRDWTTVAAGLHERYMAHPDFAQDTGGPVPSLLMGEAGILLVAHGIAPRPRREQRLLEVIEANAADPSLELMWGSPGTMLAADVMHGRTGAACWAQAWRASADRLWAAWDGDLWLQDLYGRAVHHLGPAHGWAGNVHVLWRGRRLLGDARRTELERRVVATALRHAERDGDLAQWPPSLEPPLSPRSPIRTQWCHGAPGMVASLAPIAPGDDALTDVLIAGGELTWKAGPLAKGAGLCHGTAGNGYAFLKLLQRTGDEHWLHRARAFATHATEQVHHARRKHHQGHHTLWTGDLGTACYLQSCLDATADVPTLDTP